MQFLYQPLTWGFLLVLLPLLIHLINLMRQKRVEWAAMDFLLQAYRKHRRWIWLKQFLLIAARMLAIAAVVAMLAHLVTRDQWTSFFGGKTTHHIVLLDDSYSMSDRLGAASGTSYDLANEMVRRLAERAMAQDTVQKFTLMRFSQAARSTGSTRSNASTTEGTEENEPVVPEDQVAGMFGEFADLNAAIVDGEFDILLEEKRRGADVTELSVGAMPALNLCAQLINQAMGERPIVHVLSDFRSSEWQTPTQAIAAIKQMEKGGAQVNLVRCADERHNNLAITNVAPSEGTRAAGVPLFVDVDVHNYGTQDATQVAVAMRSLYYGKDDTVTDPQQNTPEVNELPNILIERVPAGETVTRRVQVYYATSGQHVVSAELPPDTVSADNQRFCVVDFPAGIPVLVIDGDPQQQHAAYLNSVFQPGERVVTGIRPNVQPVTYLRDTQPDTLAKFRAIYLLDVPRLEPLAKQNLEDYVQAGGGVAIFMGPNCQLDFYRRWSAPRGEDASQPGFFPVPTERLEILQPSPDGTPDLVVTDHPIYRVLLREGKAFAGAIRYGQYARAPLSWKPTRESPVQVIATLRNGSPLAVERSFGDGRVVANLSTLAPIWNTWATQPTFPVMMLETQSYLDSDRASSPSRLVGTPVQ
ncbi:MAG: BatA domain-containing protein, partial [Planctomycetota bacterium]